MADTKMTIAIPQMNFRLKVQNISAFKHIHSPEVMVYGIPWKIKLSKDDADEEKWLQIYLFCAKTDKPPDWSHVASATIKLLSFGENKKTVEHDIEPYVFNCKGYGSGQLKFINWRELFDPENSYVKDDTIMFDIRIDAADPDDNNKSNMILEKVEHCCADSSLVRYRLNVSNIENLMAVKTPELKLHGQPFILTVFRNTRDMLGLRLECNDLGNDFKFETSMKASIETKATGVQSIDKTETKEIESDKFLTMHGLVAWNELLNSQNGFVANSLLVIEVEIRVKDLLSGGANATKPKTTKCYEMECAICLQRFEDQEVSFTPCGHLFCSACITDAVARREACPSCTGGLNEVKRVHLPFMKWKKKTMHFPLRPDIDS